MPYPNLRAPFRPLHGNEGNALASSGWRATATDTQRDALLIPWLPQRSGAAVPQLVQKSLWSETLVLPPQVPSPDCHGYRSHRRQTARLMIAIWLMWGVSSPSPGQEYRAFPTVRSISCRFRRLHRSLKSLQTSLREPHFASFLNACRWSAVLIN